MVGVAFRDEECNYPGIRSGEVAGAKISPSTEREEKVCRGSKTRETRMGKQKEVVGKLCTSPYVFPLTHRTVHLLPCADWVSV